MTPAEKRRSWTKHTVVKRSRNVSERVERRRIPNHGPVNTSRNKIKLLASVEDIRGPNTTILATGMERCASTKTPRHFVTRAQAKQTNRQMSQQTRSAWAVMDKGGSNQLTSVVGLALSRSLRKVPSSLTRVSLRCGRKAVYFATCASKIHASMTVGRLFLCCTLTSLPTTSMRIEVSCCFSGFALSQDGADASAILYNPIS